MTMVVAPQRSLVRKLAEVMAAVSHVPKGGHNKAQNYDFARDVDVLASVRKELALRQVILTHTADAPTWRTFTTSGGSVMHAATLRLTFTAHDGESGESLQVAVGGGEGMDSGDKQLPKATTGATKYAILKLFLIPTGDDPEWDEVTGDVPQTPRQTAPAPSQAPQRQNPPQSHPTPSRSNGEAPSASGAVFPFGKSKGMAVRGAPMKDLVWTAGAVAQSIEDPEKSRFKGKNQELLSALNAEIARQNGAAEPRQEGPPDHTDSDQIPF